ncbi:MAG TPA: hypothetical protein VFR58_06485, partial [Flavisolibacter sp.]|nr:hypothetical protein [Flavisolibacter sp.]
SLATFDQVCIGKKLRECPALAGLGYHPIISACSQEQLHKSKITAIGGYVENLAQRFIAFILSSSIFQLPICLDSSFLEERHCKTFCDEINFYSH